MIYDCKSARMKTRLIMAFMLMLITLPVTVLSSCAGTKSFDNMGGVSGNDPYVIADGNAYYYCYSTGDGVGVSKLNHLSEIGKGDLLESSVNEVYNGSSEDLYSVWAPELHQIDGSWYIYAAMCKGTTNSNYHRMYVLKCTGDDPTERFELVGQITDETDQWAIDGTVFEYGGEWYTIWSGWEKNVNIRQNLYIAHLSDPCTIDSERVMISTPDSWDSVTTGPAVNEGPCVVIENERVYCLYSGNGSWTDDYCIGYLKLSGDPMDAASWTKSEAPIIRKESGFAGPGHCSVTKTADGTSYIVYHANLVEYTGWKGRSVRIQKLSFIDGAPFVGPQKKKVRIGE